MKKNLNLWIISFILFSIFSFSGCRKTEKQGTPVTVSYWLTETHDAIKDTLEEWDTPRDDIRIQLQPVHGGDITAYMAKILSQIAGRAAPDIILVETGLFVDFFSHGALLDLNPFLKQDEDFNIDEFYPEVTQWFTQDGALYVLPRDTAPFSCVFYNKDLFDIAEITYPENNWTWDDLIRIGTALTRRNSKGTIEQYGFTTWLMMNFLYSAGGGYVDNINAPQQCILGHPGSREGLQFYHDLMWKYDIMPRPGATGTSRQDLFKTGQVAMYGSGFWESRDFRDITEFDWDIVQFPAHPQKGLKTGTGGSGYAILKTCRHPDAAWEVIKRLTGNEGQTILAELGTTQPARISLAESDIFAVNSKKPVNRKFLLTGVQNALYEPFLPEWKEINTLYIQPELDEFFYNNQTLDEALKKILPYVEKAMKNAK